MISEKVRNILVNTMGVAAIVIAVCILLWLGTVGLMLGWMNYDFNKSGEGFLSNTAWRYFWMLNVCNRNRNS